MLLIRSIWEGVHNLHVKMLRQTFGDLVASEEDDIITSLKFDDDGRYMATGDRGGRIVIFSSGVSEDDEENSVQQGRKTWVPTFQFQSHEAEFDRLKSVDTPIGINQILFYPTMRDKIMLFAVSDTVMKLWKVYERNTFYTDAVSSLESGKGLTLPRKFDNNIISSTPMWSSFKNSHLYRINSVSLSSDHETLVSADDVSINQWDLNHTDKCYSLLDIKPPRIQELSDVITGVKFNPISNYELACSTCRGNTRIMDTRSASHLEHPSIDLCDPLDSTENAILRATSVISNANYSACGRYFVTRDYMYLRVWDLHMPSSPISRVCVNDRINPSNGTLLNHLYNSENVYDKFTAIFSNDGSRVLTGSYSNQFSIWNREGRKIMQTTLPKIVSNNSSDGFQDFDSAVNLWSLDEEDERGMPSSGVQAPSVTETLMERDMRNRRLSPDSITYDSEVMDTDSSGGDHEFGINCQGSRTRGQAAVSPQNRNSRTSHLPMQPTAPVRVREKVLHCDWHPTEDTVAVASQAGVSFYAV